MIFPLVLSMTLHLPNPVYIHSKYTSQKNGKTWTDFQLKPIYKHPTYRSLQVKNTLKNDIKVPKIDVNEILHNPEVKSLFNSATDGAVTELVKASDAGKSAIFGYTRNIIMGILTAAAIKIESISGLSEQQIETTLAVAAFIGVGVLGLKHLDQEQIWNKLVSKGTRLTEEKTPVPQKELDLPELPEVELDSSSLDKSFAQFNTMSIIELQVKCLILKRDLQKKYKHFDLVDINDDMYMEMQIYQSLLKQKSPESAISKAIVSDIKINTNDFNAILRVARLAEALIVYFNVLRTVAEALIIYQLNEIISKNHFNIITNYPYLLVKHQLGSIVQSQ